MNTSNTTSLEYLQGQIERITYTNEENGYTVAKVKVRGRRDLVTVVGSIASPLAGQVLKMKGEWSNHPKFGEQFKAVFCECAVPATSAGIQRYLGSGLIKGIGPVMAKKIVSLFGDKTLDIIEHETDRLTEVDGIGQKRIEKIKKAWEEQKEIREVMLFLQGHGVSSTYASKIFKTYGKDSIKVVQDNPYRLATDIFGIGFITADNIAQKLGFSLESEFRIQAGILYVLHQLSDEGHVYYPRQDLARKAAEILKVDAELVDQQIDSLETLQYIVMESLPQQEQKAVYLAKYFYSETSIAAKLKKLIKAPKSIRQVDTDKALDWVQKTYGLNLAEKQAEAVRKALLDKILVITGGPGTGKSFLLNAILKIVSRLKVKILLAAPTGRAAKRMQESTGYEAKTIHRLLEFDFQKGGFKKNDEHPLNCDLLIVDEMSMVDTVLMHHLLKAVRMDTTLIMVGDVNQLPSVGPGNVLKDIINSGSVPVVELNEIFRQARESSIIVNAHMINQGRLPVLQPRQDKLDDFFFMQEEDPHKVLEKIKYIVMERIPQRFKLNPIDHVQVISPMNRGVVGVSNLNTELQACLNPQGQEIIRGGKTFRQGDKVMQIRNNYDKEVFNGDIGVITGLDLEEQEIKVRFYDRQVVYEYSDLDELVLAYAVSIHKSQGSDYPAVVIPLLTQHYIMLQKNLVYTGITRGKNLVVVIGTKKALAIAVKNAGTNERYTHLAGRLNHKIQEIT
ncbi:helicase, RecD/TraA family [Desulfonatronospira thiodismutans ASO3-1]|uniref:Helicase, RecD/TraA family n=1 Tax=Desulfonatronospira thiodismutans ASO3-1 TaxID=555779 RepID=D6SN07_9BACT|nr:ATP-dependent RecD-like DNA helicase [Desulfonatronospira thiodismutans]EFI36068.1 helicase, RecD/TraA family [Desulfonatronospira thiodismutans ASO3-1]